MNNLITIGSPIPHFHPESKIIASCQWRDEPGEESSYTAYMTTTIFPPHYHILVLKDNDRTLDGEIYNYENIVDAAADWSHICGVEGEPQNF